uniref:Uncharacterized protein n=1 Tax=Arundo donax TaxID=35708 RepID=A0A0A8YKX0_ARUDO
MCVRCRDNDDEVPVTATVRGRACSSWGFATVEATGLHQSGRSPSPWPWPVGPHDVHGGDGGPH